MPSVLRPIARKSLVSETIETLRRQIADGTWKVGELIPAEAVLVAQLGVGRNTVREAVRVLSRSQVLEVRQGDGTYVRKMIDPAETMERINAASFVDHLELHRSLDLEVVRLATQRRTEKDIKEIKACLKRRGERSQHREFETFVESDRALHMRIALATQNEALFELYRYFVISTEDRIKENIGLDNYPFTTFQAHVQMVQAIEEQDIKKATSSVMVIFKPLFDLVA
ncbi:MULTISPECIES: FadR/GntR family transcriptional regulator [Herbaspirillum]|uniref:FadR/GntR family transcriptional regulator n=1 Tax=Herbaspirillum TaxID=963 RepID=UPI000847EF1D|nr:MULTISPECIES: GntR family transcriptional regulator [Herbaspirillum]AON56777.1 GntR family transcriptional regulator [Herbaspirillum seropedicae]UIN21139.1 GntR family transcriptional regulator [Herbaspirillum frisingense]